ncbi:MAG: CotH kinase family protein [Clostridiales bacterium]|nr:CotH kinase family protein [Clostridiales bacterium]
MKKIVSVLVLAVSIIAVIYLVDFLGNPVNYSDCIASSAQADEIIMSREEVVGLLDSLIFNEEVLFFDAYNNTFYYSLIENDAKAFTPDIRVKSSADNVNIAFLEGEITEDLIRNNQTIPILVYTEDLYCRYNLKCTTLPLMNINCAEDISTDDMPMSMTLFDNSAVTTNRLITSEGNIHVRGNTMKLFPKKAYRISLIQESVGGNIRPYHVSLLGMRLDDDWLLYSAYNDPEKIRNVFSSNLWKYTCATDNSLGMDIGMEYRYLELFVNGEYWGLYALGYPIDEKQVGAKSSELSVIKHGINGERLQFDSNGEVIGYTSSNPDLTDNELSRLVDYYHELYFSANNNEKLYSGIDPNNVIDFYLFINLVQGFDNARMITNYYILLQDNKDGIKAFYAPWDLDLTWGTRFSYYDFPADYNFIIESGYISQLIVNGDSFLCEKIFEKYKQLRKTGWSEENINALLDKYEKDIYGSGAYLRDMERWPDGCYVEQAGGADTFRNYVMERLQESDLYYERLEKIYYETDNLFIRRSARYKDFLECSFIMEINNKDLLKDSDYTEFLEYIGIDISYITENVRFILANPSKRQFEYLDSLNENDGVLETSIGSLSFEEERDGKYNIKLNDINCYETSLFFEPEIAMNILKDNILYSFNFSKGYDIVKESQINTPEQLRVYLNGLLATNYYSVIEINNQNIWNNSEYIELFNTLGVSYDDIHDTTDFIVWNGLEKTAVVLDDFHVPGSVYESSVCSLSVFWNDAGEYGVYLDGHDCFVSSEDNNKYVDIRIVLLNPETYDIMDTQTYTCE